MRLTEYLPEVWEPSAEVIGMQKAIEPSVLAAWAAKDGFLDQLNISKATWGLHWWEESLGIEVDESKSPEFRRSRIISKVRGQGTTTVAAIKNVAESFVNGKVDVIEHPEAYTVDIKFVGTIGIPPNLDDLSAALDDIFPAHLGYEYIIIYRTWSMLEAKTWGELEPVTWGDILEGTI